MGRLFQTCAGLRDRPCAELTRNVRCDGCAAELERTRRGSPTQRYGPGYQRRHREAIVDEPWCHFPGGCQYPITPDNPLTAQHVLPASLHGPAGPLEPWCRKHNSGQGNRPV
jgi:hypothetical protein